VGRTLLSEAVDAFFCYIAWMAVQVGHECPIHMFHRKIGSTEIRSAFSLVSS
jgi:hypothetical protein